MKHGVMVILLAIVLAACTGGFAPGKHNCDKGKEGIVCIELGALDPIRYGEPVVLTITVSSDNDVPDIGVSLYPDAAIRVDDPQNWEKDFTSADLFKGGVSWKASISANKPHTFTRTIFLPREEGVFSIVAQVATPNLRASDSIGIYMTHEGGKAYLPGTAIPYTEGPLPTYNGPTLTFVPTPVIPTFPPTIWD